jgi:hypothetical protein
VSTRKKTRRFYSAASRWKEYNLHFYDDREVHRQAAVKGDA